MTDEILSQEELDALLKETVGDDGTDLEEELKNEVEDKNEKPNDLNNKDELKTNKSKITLTDVEKDTLGEIGNISMGTAATTLSTLLGKKVDITTPTVTITTSEELSDEYKAPLVAVNVKYKEGLEGSNIMILRTDDVKVITDLMMGKEEVDLNREISELDLSAVSEAMNQMMGSSSTSLSDMLGVRIDILPPEAEEITFEEGRETIQVLKGNMDLIKISFKMEIEGYLDSNLLQIVPASFGKEMVKRIMGKYAGDMEDKTQDKDEDEVFATESKSDYKANMNSSKGTEHNISEGNLSKREQVTISEPKIPVFKDEGSKNANSPINLVGDIPVEVTAELGRTHKNIGDILEFGIGTVVELNKLVGEPLNLYANGKYIASGEVVVIDDSFGIRITEIDNNKQNMI